MNDTDKQSKENLLTDEQQVIQADLKAALIFKQHFFWNAFKALDYNRIDGDYAEFGSHGCATFRLAFNQIQQRNIKRHMWAFDSFQGLPGNASPKDSHPVWQQGQMSTDVDVFHGICKSHGITREQYTVVQGFYDDTLSSMEADAAPVNIALAYIDCDMYSSTSAVLNFLTPRLKHGMILAFDDYFCYSSTQLAGERMALLELMSKETQWNFVRYRDYGWSGVSYLVEQT